MKVVLDTNVVVSAILFTKGQLAQLREDWSRGRFVPLIDTPCAEELMRVLAYPKFRLAQDEIEALLGTYIPFAEVVNTESIRVSEIPRCRDPKDQIFLILAHVGKADVLVTGDDALLALAGKTKFAIEKPAVFRGRFGNL